MKMSHLVATFFYVGHIRPAAGTWGSLAAIPAAWAVHAIGGPLLLALAIALAFFAGFWAADHYIADTGRQDPSEVVIDEVVGQWIALLPVSLGASHAEAGAAQLWPGVVAAFLLFRLFDIWKPGPVGWADQMKNAWGVMLDDVAAGWIAALLVAVFAFVWHGMLGL